MTPRTLTNTRSGSTARIHPAAGFTCFSLQIPVHGQLVDVLDSEPGFATTGERPTRNGIPLLFPFPNRIRGGRYDWNGRSYTLDGLRLDDFGNIIHGMVFDRPWRVIDSSENQITGRFQLSVDAPDRRPLWPADFVIDVRYELLEQGLHCAIRIENPDTAPLPWGFGTHAYFKVPLAPTSRRGD
jgi:aldose 1-epimerase